MLSDSCRRRIRCLRIEFMVKMLFVAALALLAALFYIARGGHRRCPACANHSISALRDAEASAIPRPALLVGRYYVRRCAVASNSWA